MSTNIFGDPVVEETNVFGDPIVQSEARLSSITGPKMEQPDYFSRAIAPQAAAGIEMGMYTPERMIRSGLDAVGWYKLLDASLGTKTEEYNRGWQDFFARREQQLDREAQALEPSRMVGPLVQGVARATTELPVQLMGGAGATSTKTAVAGSSAMAGAMGGLLEHERARQAGGSRLQSGLQGLMSGGITALTTRAFGATGVEGIFRREGIQGIRNRLIQVGKDMGLEGVEEGVDQVQQDLLERITRNPEKPMADSLNESLLAAGVGTALGGGVSTVGQTRNVVQQAFSPKPVQAEVNIFGDPTIEGGEQRAQETQRKETPEVLTPAQPSVAVETPTVSTALPDVHGGGESTLTPEQRAISRANNSREAFRRLQAEEDAKKAAVESQPEVEAAKEAGVPVGEVGWNATRRSFVESLNAKTGKTHVPAILYDSGDVIPGTSHGTLVEAATEGAKPLSSGWVDASGKFFAGSNPPAKEVGAASPAIETPAAAPALAPSSILPDEAKPDWVKNLEQVERGGQLNEDQKERLAKWRKQNPATVGTPETKAEAEKRTGETLLYTPTLRMEGFEQKFKAGREHDATQMLNWMRNQQPGEYAMLESVGVRKAFPEGSKATPEKMMEWAKESGPRVEVRKFGVAQAVTPELREEARLAAEDIHALDTAGFTTSPQIGWQAQQLGEGGGYTVSGPTGFGVIDRLSPNSSVERLRAFGISEENVQRIRRVLALRPDKNKQETHWQSIAPKSEQDMPGYVEIAVVKPVGESELKTAYSKLYPGDTKFEQYDEGSRRALRQSAEQFPSSHHFPPNTLGFVRGYMETTKEGKKVFHVIEVQSDWAQQAREFSREGNVSSRLIESGAMKEPLLPHWERLALKAAIEHAKEQGADAIAISDSLTARMTEGHDLEGFGSQAQRHSHGAPTKEAALRHIKEEASRYEREIEPSTVTYNEIADRPSVRWAATGYSFKKGMRLHYDQILPRIAEELTGSKGERVEFGEHKMAYVTPNNVGTELGSQPRQNLIFRNPDGTPKTSVSARMFPLSAARSEFSLTGKDRPVQKQAAPQGKPSADDARHINALNLSEKQSAFQALQRLASNSRLYSQEQRAMADFLLRNFGEVLRSTALEQGAAEGEKAATYNPSTKKIHLAVGVGEQFDIPFRLLHEGLHAATYWQLEHPRTEVQVKAAEEIKALFEKSKAALGKDASHLLQYYHQSTAEFVAGLSDAEFREHLNSIPVEGPSWLERMIDAVKALLGIKQGTALDKAFDALVAVGKEGSTEATGKATRPLAAPGTDPLPMRFGTYAEEKRAATSPQFLGKVPLLRKLFDPARIKESPEEQALVTHTLGEYKVDSALALMAEQLKDRKRGFKPDEQGRVTLADGSKEYLSDVVEKSLVGATLPLTPDQQKFIDWWRRLNAEGIRYAQEQGVKFFLDEHGQPKELAEGYFPRPPVGERKQGSRLPGVKGSSLKERFFATEEQGAKAGVKYAEDEYGRAMLWLQSVYRAVLNKRLAEDAALKGRAGIRLVPIKDAKGVDRMMLVGKGPKRGEGGVYGVPAFQARVYPLETAKRIQNYFNRKPGSITRWIAKANDEIKGAKFAGDVSAPLNQGLPLLAFRPGRWAKATVESYGAFLEALVRRESSALNEYLKDPENARVARLTVENGGSVGRLEDFLRGTRKESFVARVPIYGRVIRAGGESMNTFLSIAKLELFKALEPMARKSGTPLTELVETIENVVLSGRMEGLGMSQSQALAERLLFNAPSYMRAAANLMFEGAKGAGKGVGGKETTLSEKVSRNALLRLGTALTMLMFAAYKIQGLDDEEIKERFDPRSWKFARFRIPLGKEQAMEGSMGNILLSVMRVLGGTAEVLTGDKKVGPGTEKDPWLRWLSYRKGPFLNFLTEWYTGKDYRGLPVTKVEAFQRMFTPIAAESFVNEGFTRQSGAEAGLTFVGGSAFPAPKPTAQELMRKRGSDLKTRREIAREVSERPKGTLEEQQLMERRAQDFEFERRAEIAKAMPKEVQAFLREHQLNLPGYQSSLTIGGRRLPLTKEEREQEQAAVTEEYAKELSNFISKFADRVEGWEADGSLQRRLNHRLELARGKARIRTFKMIKGQPGSPLTSGGASPR